MSTQHHVCRTLKFHASVHADSLVELGKCGGIAIERGGPAALHRRVLVRTQARALVNKGNCNCCCMLVGAENGGFRFEFDLLLNTGPVFSFFFGWVLHWTLSASRYQEHIWADAC